MGTHIGFGCAKLTHHFSAKGGVNNLETAYSQGITHFDVARSYGFGGAERILGKFARNKRDKITITTKLGIRPAHPALKNLVVQNIMRSASQWLKPKTVRSAAANLISTTHFSIESAERSLQISLRELGTDYVDCLLLHEATVGQSQKEDIRGWLENAKSKGMIKAYGIGSYAQQLLEDIDDLPVAFRVLQTDNCFPFVNKLPDHVWRNRQLFFFSPYRYASEVRRVLSQNNDLKTKVATLLDIDIDHRWQSLFLMQGKLFHRPNTTLFTSSSNQKIGDTIAEWHRVDAASPSLKERFTLVQTMLAAQMELYR